MRLLQPPGDMGMSVEIEDKDLGWLRIKKELKSYKNSYTAIGYYGHGGDPSEDLAARAGVNEFGAKICVTKKMRGFFKYKWGINLKTNVIRIPARPFMRKTYDNNKRKINKQIEMEYNRILEGKQTAKKALTRLGMWYKGLTQITIRKGGFEPNKPLTIQNKRGSTKPLINTGQLYNEIDHREFIK